MNLEPYFEDADIITALDETKGLVFDAAELIGCSVSTIYRRSLDTPAIKEAMQRHKGKRLDKAEYKLFDLIDAGNLGAIIFYLKTQGRDRGYIERLHITFDAAKLYEFTEALEALGVEPGTFMDETIARAQLESGE